MVVGQEVEVGQEVVVYSIGFGRTYIGTVVKVYPDGWCDVQTPDRPDASVGHDVSTYPPNRIIT